MSRDDNLTSDRRAFLKSIGLTASAVTLGTSISAGTAAATSHNKPKKDWTDQYEFYLGDNDHKSYHSTDASWYHSEYYDSRGWMHDVSLGTTGVSQWNSGIALEDIIGNYYEFWPKDYQDDGLVDQDTRGQRHGIWPDNKDESMEEWIEFTTDLAVGSLSAPSAFALAADDFAEMLQEQDGFKGIKNDKGFRFLHTVGYFEDNWSDIAHFQRALYESGFEAKWNDTLIIRSKLGRTPDDYDSWIEYEIMFWKNDEPLVDIYKWDGEKNNSPNASTSSSALLDSTTTSTVEKEALKDAMVVSTGNPYEMTDEERDRIGLVKVNPDNPPAGVEGIDGEYPNFVAKTMPIAVVGRAWKEAPDGTRCGIVQNVLNPVEE